MISGRVAFLRYRRYHWYKTGQTIFQSWSTDASMHNLHVFVSSKGHPNSGIFDICQRVSYTTLTALTPLRLLTPLKYFSRSANPDHKVHFNHNQCQRQTLNSISYFSYANNSIFTKISHH